jgi:nucleoside-diphosphate-sugar epimerase
MSIIAAAPLRFLVVATVSWYIEVVMKVLITGGAGFVGANFVHSFVGRGDNVHLIVRPESNLWRIRDVQEKVTLHTLDLSDRKETTVLVASLEPEVILHFATYGAYQGREQDPEATVRTNVLGTMNLLLAASSIPLQCFINTGSSSEYGIKDAPMRESDTTEPTNLYGATKASATLLADYVARTAHLPVITMRLFSVYGPYEDRGRFVPVLVNAYLRGGVPTLLSPDFVRDFIHIDDVIGAYQCAIERIGTVRGNVFNVGSGVQHMLADAVACVKECVGSTADPVYSGGATPQQEPAVWVADISKARRLLEWEPKLSLAEGLRKDVEWFRSTARTEDWYV